MKKIDELQNKASSIDKLWADFYPDFEERLLTQHPSYDWTSDVGKANRSLQEVAAELVSFLATIISVDSESLIPTGVYNRMVGILESIESTIESWAFHHEEFTISDPSALTINPVSGGSRNLASELSTIATNLDRATGGDYAWFLLNTHSVEKKFFRNIASFSSAYRKIADARRVITRYVNDAKSELEDIQELEKISNSASVAATTFKEAAQTSAKDAEGWAQKSESAKNKILEEKEIVSRVEKEATALKSEVTTFRKDFKKYQQEIDENVAAIAIAKNGFEERKKEYKSLSEKIVAQTHAANDMLKGATTAGLAKEFAERASELSWSLFRASILFYIAIGLLFLSSVPLILTVVPPVARLLELALSIDSGILAMEVLPSTSESTDFGRLLEAFARFLIIFPFVWLVSFSSRRYGRIFRLREHYAYKRSLAASVEGFKKQAPSYEDEIAAAVFHELSFNPADRMDRGGDDGRPPNPVLRWILDKVRAKFDTAVGE